MIKNIFLFTSFLRRSFWNDYSKKQNKQSGVSLLEIVLVVALFAAITAFGAPVFNDFKIKNDLDIAQSNVVSSLRRAQALSQSVANDSSWGVYVTSGEAIVFQGDSYTSRDSDYDESLYILEAFELSGIDEVVFEKMSGNASSTGSIVISSANESKSITINSKGTISF